MAPSTGVCSTSRAWCRHGQWLLIAAVMLLPSGLRAGAVDDPNPLPSSSLLVQQHSQLLSGKSTYDLTHLSPSDGKHGWVNKGGMVDLNSWSLHQVHHQRRQAEFEAWRAAEDRRRAAGQPPSNFTCIPGGGHPRYSFPSCHVFVNHKYKYIYIRSPKSASTSIVNQLGECHWKKSTHWNASTCMLLQHNWQHKDPRATEKMWREYFVFAFVSNPWKRAFSLFQYLNSKACIKQKYWYDRPERCKMPWKDFCVNPFNEVDRLHKEGCMSVSNHYSYFHMMDQTHCMVTSDMAWAIDFVGRVEHAAEDWPEIIKEINRRRPEGEPELAHLGPLTRDNVARDNGYIEPITDPYAGEVSHCLDHVSRWYACDVERFGYLMQ